MLTGSKLTPNSDDVRRIMMLQISQELGQAEQRKGVSGTNAQETAQGLLGPPLLADLVG